MAKETKRSASVLFRIKVARMAATNCATAAAAIMTAGGIPGRAAGGAARATPTARVLATSASKTTRTATAKGTVGGPAAGPVQLNTARGLPASSRLAAASRTVTRSPLGETLPPSLNRTGVLLSQKHLLRSSLPYRREVFCAIAARRLSSYARFAQNLRSRYNSTPTVSASASASGVKDSPTNTHCGTGGRSTIASSTCSVQQSKGHFDVNGQQVFVSSTSTIPGYTVVSYKGFVQGCSVQARDMLLMAKVFLLVQLGGEVEDMASLIQRAKTEAVERLCREAAAVGANAVIGVRLVSSGTHQRTAVEFSAYGTAVSVKKAL